MNKKKDVSVIPKGIYCYDGNYRCPYWQGNRDGTVFCQYLEEGGIDNDCTDKQYDSLIETFGSEEEVDKVFPLDLLWDHCKECGENDDFTEKDWDELEKEQIKMRRTK